jgi:hypothetical protein
MLKVLMMKLMTSGGLSDKMDIANMTSSMPLFRGRGHRQQEKLAGIEIIMFQHTVSNKFSLLLAKHSIRTIHILVKKNVLRPVITSWT